MSIDLEGLLDDLSPGVLCGENLSCDPAYLAQERPAQGTPELQMGETIVAGHEPNWRDGLALILGPLERHWEYPHQQLDPDDDNDPMDRSNMIGSLSPSQRARGARSRNSRQHGQFSVTDIQFGQGRINPSTHHGVSRREAFLDPCWHLEWHFNTVETACRGRGVVFVE